MGVSTETEDPPSSEASDYVKRDYRLRCSRAHAYIERSISEDLRDIIEEATTAVEAWTILCNTYEPRSRARIATLQREFYELRYQPGEQMAAFIGRVYNVKRQLENAGRPVVQDDISYLLIGSLPKSYESLTYQIYQANDTEFTPEKIKRLLLSEEVRQKQMERDETAADAFSVHVKKPNAQAEKNTDKRHHVNERNQEKQSQSFQGDCFECGRKGHRARDCRNRKSKSKSQIKDKGDKGPSKGAFFASAMYTTAPSDTWVMDSAATHHFCNRRDWFCTFTTLNTEATVGEGKSRVEGRGDIWIQMLYEPKKQFCLRNVIYAPKMGRNLISIRLIDQAGYYGKFNESTFTIYFPQGHYAFEARLTQDNFYTVHAEVIKQYQDEPDTKTAHLESYQSSSDAKNKMKGIELWHVRLGHINQEDLKYMAKEEMLQGLKPLTGNLDTCIPCKLSKSTRQPFKKTNHIRSSEVLELVHSDVWGPSPVVSLGGAKYFITFIDDKSRLIQVYTMVQKSEAFTCFKKYKAQMERQTGKKLKALRTDNGLEYCSNEFTHYCETEGINLERTNIYSPPMNGVAERVNRTLLNTVRTIMEDTKLPTYLWGELILTAAHIKNRSRHSLLDKLPIEYWMGRRPSANYLKRIGCLAFAHVPPQHRRNKFQKRAKLGVLVGYAMKTRGYRIWYPSEKKVKETKHVTFDEDELGVEKHKLLQEERTLMIWPSEDEEKEIIVPIPACETHKTPKKESESADENSLEERLQIRYEESPTRGEQPESADDNSSMKDKLPHEKTTIKGITQIPEGWHREVPIRQKGASAGEVDIYYRDPDGKIWRSYKSLAKHIKDNELSIDPKVFDFSKKNLAASLISSITQDDISDVFQAYCAEVITPNNYHEAIQSPQREEWKLAMDDEVETLKQRGVAKVIPKPDAAKVVGCRWVYQLKKNNEGKIIRYRARLVAQGFNQVEGEDYNQSFSPVVNFSLIRLFLTIFVITFGWVHEHMDIKNAYLYGNLEKEVLMKQIPGYEVGDPKQFCLKLCKALYGLPQSGRQWYLALEQTFQESGFTKLLGTNCIYIMPNKAIVLVYVDDLIVLTKDNRIMDSIYDLLSIKYDIKRLGPITKLLGVEFQFLSNSTLKMTQSSYIKQVANRFGIYADEPVSLPIPSSIILTRKDCPDNDKDKNCMKDIPYRELVGCLLFVAQRTRPDILFTVIALSQYNNNPGYIHWTRLCQLTRYLLSTSEYGITYHGDQNLQLTIYCDSDWGADRDTRKSTSGYILYLGSCPISWRSLKQKSVSLSTMEAEYVAISEAVKELLWILPIIKELKVINLTTPVILCDNQSAIFYSHNSVENQRSKHIDIKFHFVREKLSEGMFILKYVQSNRNVADIFTKLLPKSNFDNCIQKLMLK